MDNHERKKRVKVVELGPDILAAVGSGEEV